MSFHNKRYFTKQTFDLLESSLRVQRRGILSEIEYEIPFTAIMSTKTVQTEINHNLIVAGLFFVVFSSLFLLGSDHEITVILLSIGIIMVVVALINRRKIVTIPTYGSESITLFYTAKNKKDVIGFASEIIDASNNYFLKRYTKIDRALPIERQLEHLQFLFDRAIIDEAYFESLKNQLLGREGKTPIGFG